MNTMPLLLIPEKLDEEFKAVIDAWQQRGGEVRLAGKYWIKDEALADKLLAVYGNLTFSLVLAQIYELELVCVDDIMITTIGRQWTKRTVFQRAVGSFTESDFPVFIKPAIPKSFQNGVFASMAAFREVTAGVPDHELALAANVIDISAEARAFVLDGVIMDIALYSGAAMLEAGKDFLAAFLADHKSHLPVTLVIDLAFAENAGGWMILEFNATWGAGLNNCDATKVIDCIIAATGKPGRKIISSAR